MIPKEDLRWYLFEETIEMFTDFGYKNYEQHRYNDLNRFLSDYYILRTVGVVAKIRYNISKFYSKCDNDVWVHDLLNRYPNIINHLELNFNPLFFGANIGPFKRSLKGKINYYPLYSIYKDLYNGIIDYNDDLLEISYSDLENVLKKIDPKIIILNHDFTSDTKLVALVARELGIPTVEIQHGIYSDKKIVPGKYADYVFVWGDYFKNLYLKSKMKQNREIKVLGYPYSIKEENNLEYTKKIVYLGQNLELYGNSFFDTKKETLKQLNRFCIQLGFELVYRPHPSEDLNFLKMNLPGVKFSPEGEKLEDAIKHYDIFIAFNSTALAEAVLNSKIGLQLKNYKIPADDFEKLGICRSFTSLKELKEFLEKLKTVDDVKRHYSPVDPHYIEIPSPSPGEKFIELIKEIL